MAEFRLDIDFAPISRLNNELKTLVNSINGASTNMNKSAEKLKSTAVKTSSALSKEMGFLENTVNRISFVITATLSYSVWSGFIKGMTEARSGFESIQRSLAELKTLFAGVQGGDAIAEQLFADVDKLSIKYGRSIDEVTKAIYNNVSAGRLGVDANKVLESSMNLSVVTGTELDKTIRLVNRTINAFSLEASDATQVTETFFKMVQKGDIRLEETVNSLGKVAAAASNLGLSYKEVVGIYTALVKVLPAREASTSLTNIIAKLSLMPEVIQEINDSGFENWLRKISALTTEQQTEIFGNMRGLRGMAILLKDIPLSGDTYKYFLEDTNYLLEETNGLLDTNKEKINQLKQSLSAEFRNRFGEAISDTYVALLSLLNFTTKNARTLFSLASMFTGNFIPALTQVSKVIPTLFTDDETNRIARNAERMNNAIIGVGKEDGDDGALERKILGIRNAINAQDEELKVLNAGYKAGEITLEKYQAGLNKQVSLYEDLMSIIDVTNDEQIDFYNLLSKIASLQDGGKAIDVFGDKLKNLRTQFELFKFGEGNLDRDAFTNEIRGLISNADAEVKLGAYKLLESLNEYFAEPVVDELKVLMDKLQLQFELGEFGLVVFNKEAAIHDLEMELELAEPEMKLIIARFIERIKNSIPQATTPTRENPILKWIGMDDREHNWLSQAIDDVKEFAQKFQATISTFTSSISSLWDSYYAMKASKRQEDLDDALRVLDEQQAKEEEMVAAAALTEEQRRKSLAAIADKYDAERAKKEEKERQVQAKERKKQAIYDMAINFAQGVMNIWSQWAKLPVVAGILTGVLSGIYGLQLAAVNSTKFAKGGILQGASHANGGIDMGNGQEAEGGEAVINKRSTAMFKPLLGLINSLGGGVNFSDVKVKPYMATGGITVPTTRNDSLMRRAFEKLAQFEPVILQGVTDRDIYRASVSGRPVGAF